MYMIEKIILEWHYKPNDYFDDNFTIEYDRYKLEINSGVATAIIPPEYMNSVNDISNKLTQDLESRFLAVQVMTHQKYNLEKSLRYDLNRDGSKNFYIQVEDIICVSSVSPVDLILQDANGNVLLDTKKKE